MMRWMEAVLGLALASAVLAPGYAEAVPQFFVASGPGSNGDNAWHLAVGTFVEDNLEGHTGVNGFGDISSITLGGVTVNFSLPNVLPNPLPGAQLFTGGFGDPTDVNGTVGGQALLNRFGNADSTVQDTEIEFTFSQPVKGFGLWVFDNSESVANSFTMTANGYPSYPTYPALDADPGNVAHTVEGFLGVYDPAGITSVKVTNTTPGSFFEVDHLQLAVPEPGSLMLLGSGLVGLGLAARRRWTS
jgi:hypothetical protein